MAIGHIGMFAQALFNLCQRNKVFQNLDITVGAAMQQEVAFVLKGHAILQNVGRADAEGRGDCEGLFRGGNGGDTVKDRPGRTVTLLAPSHAPRFRATINFNGRDAKECFNRLRDLGSQEAPCRKDGKHIAFGRELMAMGDQFRQEGGRGDKDHLVIALLALEEGFPTVHLFNVARATDEWLKGFQPQLAVHVLRLNGRNKGGLLFKDGAEGGGQHRCIEAQRINRFLDHFGCSSASRRVKRDDLIQDASICQSVTRQETLHQLRYKRCNHCTTPKKRDSK